MRDSGSRSTDGDLGHGVEGRLLRLEYSAGSGRVIEPAAGGKRDWLAGDRRETSRRLIIDAATAMVRERGNASFSAEEVAERAGCSRATLYRYVGGQSAIVGELVQRGLRNVVDKVRDASANLVGVAQIETGILAATAAIRSDPILIDTVRSSRPLMQQSVYACALRRLPLWNELDLEDGGAVQLTVRFIWSLIDYPVDEASTERALVRRFAQSIVGISYPSR